MPALKQLAATTALIGILVASVALAQERAPATAATGLLLGQVVDAAGAPVSGAAVALNGGFTSVALTTVARPLPGGSRRTLTNSDGRFAFFDLPKGSYSITAEKAGYLPGAYGRQRYGGAAQSIELGEGERNTSLRIRMWEHVSISGTVVDEAGEPMVGVRVTTLRRGFEAGHVRLSASDTDITDDQGAYRIDALTPGTYTVCILSTQTTQPVSMVDAFNQAIAEGSTPASITSLGSGGTAPVINVGAAGRRIGDHVLLSDNGARRPIAPPDAGRTFAYPTACYPAATSTADAQALVLPSGASRSGVDFSLRPAPTTSVSGTLVGPDGPVPDAVVRLAPSYADDLTVELGFEVAVTATDARGAFTFLGVPRGHYTLRSLKTPSGSSTGSGGYAPSPDPTLWASLPVSVGDDPIANINVVLSRGFRISGRMEFDGTLPRPGPELVQNFGIQLDPIEGHGSRMAPAYRGSVDREGRITTNEIPPGKYYVLFLAFANDRQAMPGWETIGATIEGRDVSNLPLDLEGDVTNLVMTLSDRPAEITGTARDAQGRADPGAAVLMFPSDRARWTDYGFSTRSLRQVRASEDGVFRIRGVPPGDYFLAAIPDEEVGDWQDPGILEAASRAAARVTIAKSEKRTQDVTTTPLRRGER